MTTKLKFISDGNASFGHLTRFVTNVEAAAFDASWSTLEIQPDLFAPQSFTIGVVVQPLNQRIHYHLLADPKKFDCIYGDRFSKDAASAMLTHAELTLRDAAHKEVRLEKIEFGTSNLKLSKPMFSSGDSIETIVERLYGDLVVLEPHDVRDVNAFVSMDTSTVRRLVNEKLKQIASLDYERFVIQSDEGVLIHDGDKTHHLDVNLRTTSACGSVISAVYKTVQSIEINLLRANLDLTTYSRINNLSSNGVFLMLPDANGLDPKEWRKIEDVIGEGSWKLEREGFQVVSHLTPEALAKDIYDWALPTL